MLNWGPRGRLFVIPLSETELESEDEYEADFADDSEDDSEYEGF